MFVSDEAVLDLSFGVALPRLGSLRDHPPGASRDRGPGVAGFRP